MPVLTSFRRWKVCVLKLYCSRHGLPISWKCNDEFVALAYAATVAKLPGVLSKNEESQCVLEAAEYQQLFAVGETVVPDPLTELTVGWQSQEDGIKNKDLFIGPVVVNTRGGPGPVPARVYVWM